MISRFLMIFFCSKLMFGIKRCDQGCKPEVCTHPSSDVTRVRNDKGRKKHNKIFTSQVAVISSNVRLRNVSANQYSIRVCDDEVYASKTTRAGNKQ